MFGKHTAICQLVSPIVNAISPQHITILSGERSPLIFISVRQSSNIFSKLSYFAQFPLPTSSCKGGRLSDYIIGSEGCGWRERNIPWLTLLFAEQGQWTDSVRAGLQTAQPAGDRLLRAGVHQQQGSHGRVLVPSLYQQLGEFVSKI